MLCAHNDDQKIWLMATHWLLLEALLFFLCKPFHYIKFATNAHIKYTMWVNLNWGKTIFHLFCRYIDFPLQLFLALHNPAFFSTLPTFLNFWDSFSCSKSLICVRKISVLWILMFILDVFLLNLNRSLTYMRFLIQVL